LPLLKFQPSYIYSFWRICIGTNKHTYTTSRYNIILYSYLSCSQLCLTKLLLPFFSHQVTVILTLPSICRPYLWLSHSRYCSRPYRPTVSLNTFSVISLNYFIYIFFLISRYFTNKEVNTSSLIIFFSVLSPFWARS